MPILICSDRDGTMTDDENYYLGSHPDWPSQVRILPGVIEGIRLLNTIPDSYFFMITNQPAVAVTHPSLAALTEARVAEVNQFIVERLQQEGLRIDGFFSCPYAPAEYADRMQAKGFSVDPARVVDGHPDYKPKIGMIEKAAQSAGRLLAEFSAVYVIGDRELDVQAGLNAGGKGILVASSKTKEEGAIQKVERLREQYPERVFVADDFLAAANWIADQ